MKIAILGSNSIAGNFISQKFSEADIQVENYSKSQLNFNLYKLDEIDFNKYDFVIDFAYKYNASKKEFSREKEIKHSVLNKIKRKYIYISSLSAGEHNNSIYSQQKQNLEIIIKNQNSLVIKIGWLYDKSGNISTRQSDTIKRLYNFAPVTPDNISVYYITYFNTLHETLLKIINDPNYFFPQNTISIYDEKYLGLSLFLTNNFGLKRKALFYIPSSLFLMINKLFRSLKIRIFAWDRFSNFFLGMNK
jgi:dTDP-4-dehydrorhamnose reductase